MQKMTTQNIDNQQSTPYLNNQLLIQKERGRVNRTSSGVALWQHLNHFQMKKVILSLFAVATAGLSFAQDAAQAKGTWYLGSANATDLVNIFSTGMTSVQPTIGYAVADNIVVSLDLSSVAMVDEFGDSTEEVTSSSYGLGAAYFLESNFFFGASVNVGLETETDFEDVSSLAFGLAAGKFIPVRENWYLTPQLGFNALGIDYGGSVTNTTGMGSLGLQIGFGARF